MPTRYHLGGYQRRSAIGKTLDSEGHPVYSGAWWALALPRCILPLYFAWMAGTLAVAVERPGANATSVWGGLLAGFAIWTLFEYVLHRWMLHNRGTPLVRKVFWEALHKEHHLLRGMKDLDHHGIHPAISLPVIALVTLVTHRASSGAFALAAAAGWTLGYFAYEGLHWVFHSGTPGMGLHRVPLIRYLHDCHAVHHLEDARKNYGFTTMFWDRVFRTYLRA